MRPFWQSTMIFGLAMLLAVGPGWCRLHCQAASTDEVASVASCCQSQAAESSSPGMPPGSDCRCQAQPVTNDARTASIELPSFFLAASFLSAKPQLLSSDERLKRTLTVENPLVPIHVLKCVWRC